MTNFNHCTTSPPADQLLILALIAPEGAIKGELAFAACMLTGRASPDHGNPDLYARVLAIRNSLADQFAQGSGVVSSSVIQHLDDALAVLSRPAATDAAPLPQVQPA